MLLNKGQIYGSTLEITVRAFWKTFDAALSIICMVLQETKKFQIYEQCRIGFLENKLFYRMSYRVYTKNRKSSYLYIHNKNVGIYFLIIWNIGWQFNLTSILNGK